MVLTRQHIRRLWWPEPGSGGGGIPSRSERTIGGAAFDQSMPKEFWREVVDRVAEEGLDTLLLAEAFWLLEGYFVRTLGMHRVYNSAFMHMLRDERNAEYRLVMRNTIGFDPEVLKRFVNFMSNPDEETAVEQFGKGDKYFGVCTLLATLPGLPMFSHGQVEGYSEKYGMEYRRAYFDESVDEDLVARHEREMFPLLRRRGQFAEVRDFVLYDFFTDAGWVNEDVYAYSNGRGGERSLIIYNNRYGSTSGYIRESTGYPTIEGKERPLLQRTVAEALALPVEDGAYVTFRDYASQLEYVRSTRELRDRGLWISLEGYGRNVFLDFREVYDGAAGLWGRLAERLAGQGVPSLNDAFEDLIVEGVRGPFERIVNADVARELVLAASQTERREPLIEKITWHAGELAAAAADLAGLQSDSAVQTRIAEVQKGLKALLATADRYSDDRFLSDPNRAGALLSLLALRALNGSAPGPDGRRHLDEWRLGSSVTRMYRELGVDDGEPDRWLAIVRALGSRPAWSTHPARDPRVEAQKLADTWFDDEVIKAALGVNLYNEVLWFRAESFEELVALSHAAEAIKTFEAGSTPAIVKKADGLKATAAALREMAANSGYRVDGIHSALAPKPARRRAPQAPAPQAPPTAGDGSTQSISPPPSTPATNGSTVSRRRSPSSRKEK
jgi:hypothetical protein